jgi:peptide/nickel transport system ATP-binding protein
MNVPVLDIDGLHVELTSANGRVPLLDGVSLEIQEGQTLGLVGESGSGKSLTARAVMHLLDRGLGIAKGRIAFLGEDITELTDSDMRRVRGAGMSMIFQEPMTALDPCFTIGSHLVAALRAHRAISRKAARQEAAGLLERVRMPDPERILRQYPFELSGGMNQRALIAMAIACSPRLLIADEPTTALDVTVQAEILDLIRDLQRTLGTSVLFISHDLGVVAQLCRRVSVMYAGRVVESGSVTDVLQRPAHPYTRALRACIPGEGAARSRLANIPGEAAAAGVHPGCSFAPRCAHAWERCTSERPALLETADRQQAAACHLVDEAGERRSDGARLRPTAGDQR